VNYLSKGKIVSAKIKNFQRFALTSTVATYFLIFIGGLVRVSGAGLGCPDWPKCFGRWIPPLSTNQIPVGFDVTNFNLTLAWIEYINRLAGMITGLLILITALLAIKNFRDSKQILIPSVLSALLVAIQGWYGSVVVKTQLMPATVSIHLLLALIIVSLLVYVTYGSYHISPATQVRKIQPERKWLLILWLVSVIQVLFGAGIRSTTEIIWEQFPLLMAGEVLDRVGILNYLHTILGIFLAVGTVMIGQKVVKINNISIVSKQSIGLLYVIIFLQIFIGINLHLFGLPPFLQVFHLWLASLFIGVLLIVYTDLKFEQVNHGK
jgi:cytochrome c oxidase assembly protein subunit 15